MSGHRKRPKTITDLVSFGEDMSTISKLLIKYDSHLDTGGEHYRLIRDLHLQLCEVTLKVTGESQLPWVAWARGSTWPSPK